MSEVARKLQAWRPGAWSYASERVFRGQPVCQCGPKVLNSDDNPFQEQTVKENPVMLELQVSQEAKDQRVNEEMMDPRVTRVNLDLLGSLEPLELRESLVLRVNR